MNEPITDDHSIMEIIAANPLLREDAGPNGKKSVYSTYGYIYDPDSICLMKVDEKSAPTIRYIFHQFTAGIELNQIATALTQKGIPSPSKRRSQMGYSYKKCHVAEYWDTISLHKILTNSAYIGDHIYNLPQLPKCMREQAARECPIPPGSVIHHHHEAIISTEEFERAGILLRCQTKNYNSKPRKNPHEKPPAAPFCNSVYCGDCGRHMYYYGKPTRTNPEPVYLCTSLRSKAPDPCPRVPFKVSGIVAEVRKAILKERDFAKSVADLVATKQHCSVYLAHEKKIADKIVKILDTALLQKSLEELPDQQILPLVPTEKLQDELFELIQQKDSLYKTLTTPNTWLELFSNLPDDFVLDRELSKKLVDRVYVYLDKPCEVTFKRMKEKQALMKYLCYN